MAGGGANPTGRRGEGARGACEGADEAGDEDDAFGPPFIEPLLADGRCDYGVVISFGLGLYRVVVRIGVKELTRRRRLAAVEKAHAERVKELTRREMKMTHSDHRSLSLSWQMGVATTE
ncbi:hypothetical protein U1Q18_000194 [Sarracenia purpurea var. burkii]